MLAVLPPQRNNLDKNGNNNNNNKRSKGDATTEEANFSIGGDEFPDIPGANNLLDSIDFDDFFMGLHDGSGHDLLDLEMDPELLLVEFEAEEYSSEGNNNGHISFDECDGSNNGSSELVEPANTSLYKEIEKFMSIDEEEEIESKKDQESPSTTTTTTATTMVNSSIKKRCKGKSNKNHQDKRKSKVDWTPKLHKKFVEAVEKLGVDKAVPSRILELMGIHSLTRHNIASHLQKYRSHKKHLLVRETESANWRTQTRQIYAYGNIARGGGNGGCTISPWHHRPAMMGFPPSTTMHPAHHFRPLHVWGHPTIPANVDLRARMPSHSQPTWAPPQPQLPPDPSFWHSPHQHWSERSIDATIGDVLAKPWLPLPIGLKPPSVDSVLVELQCQGITKIPP